MAYSDVVITVDRDGRVTRSSSDARFRRPPYTLTAKQLGALSGALRDADLAHLRSSTRPVPPDAYEYTLTSEGHTVRFVEGELPPALVRAIALIEGRAYAA